jgi:hypothetical protein
MFGNLCFQSRMPLAAIGQIRPVLPLVTSSIRGEGSLGVRLLTDIQTVFGEREALATKTLLAELINMDESVWAEGKAPDRYRTSVQAAALRGGVKGCLYRRANS